VSEINSNIEEEIADMMCSSCIGTFQRLQVQSTGLFSRKIFI